MGDLLSYLQTTVAFSLNHPAIGEAFQAFLEANRQAIAEHRPTVP